MDRPASTRLWLMVGLLIALSLGLSQWVRQESGEDSAQGSALDRTMRVFRDASGKMDIPAVAHAQASGRFLVPSEDDLVFGYTHDAVWTTMLLTNDGDVPLVRYLEVGPPRIDDVRLYYESGAGHFREIRGGLQVPVRERLIPVRQTVFPLHLPAHSATRVYLRLQSGNALAMDLRLWEPARFRKAAREVDLFNSLQFGVLLVFAFYAFVTALVLRERSYGFFGLTLLGFAAYDFTMLQYGFQYVWTASPAWSLRGPGVVLAIAAFSLGQMVSGLLEASRQFPARDRWLRGLSCLALALVPGLLLGDYRAWMQALNWLALAQLALTMTATLQAVAGGRRGALLLLGAFVLLWLTFVIRAGQITGLLQRNLMAEYSQGWSMVLGGLLVAMTQAGRFRRRGDSGK